MLAARVHDGMNEEKSAGSFPRAGRAKLPGLPGHVARLRADLETAREAQRRLSSGQLPRIRGLDYYGECRPVRDAGGDFHDFVSLAPHGLAVSVGELSGHGLGAGILMSGLRALWRGLAALGPGGIGRAVRDLNRAAWQAWPGDFYATLFHACVDPVSRQLEYVNAGHESALLVRCHNERVHRLESTGTVLGLSDRTVYGRRTLPLEPGDLLIAHTDGVTDAGNSEGVGFGEQGILRAVERHPGASACDLAREILEALDRHAGRGRQDDQTVVVVRFKGAAAHGAFETAEEAVLAA
jgi:serine phosphatase RsbU (regulator of sigma subunit)